MRHQASATLPFWPVWSRPGRKTGPSRWPGLLRQPRQLSTGPVARGGEPRRQKGPFYAWSAYMPCILVEVAFRTNETEGQRIATQRATSGRRRRARARRAAVSLQRQRELESVDARRRQNRRVRAPGRASAPPPKPELPRPARSGRGRGPGPRRLAQFVDQTRDRLHRWHDAGASGVAVVESWTRRRPADRVPLRRRDRGLSPSHVQLDQRCAVLRAGRLRARRAEPAPDIDLLFLYPHKVTPYVEGPSMKRSSIRCGTRACRSGSRCATSPVRAPRRDGSQDQTTR